jgi:tetratricopeptide (TPR) repeat protein
LLLRSLIFVALCTYSPAPAQITSAPEFKSGPVFQKDRSAATVDGTSHASAEKAQLNAEVLSRLRQLSGYAGGVRLIEGKLLPEAQKWFRDQKLPIGVAVTLFFSGQEEEGVRQLISIGRSNPSSVEIVPFLAETALVVPSLTATALEVIEKISAKNPSSSEAYYYRARLTRNQESASIELLKKSIALDPAATAPLIELSRIYTRTGDRPAAIEALEKVLVLKPDTSIAHYRLASLYRAMGQHEKASSHMAAFQKLQ